MPRIEDDEPEPKMGRIVHWFGGNTRNSEAVGKALRGLSLVYVPFGGGMSEVPWIKTSRVLVNDLHRHVINLCRTVQNPQDRKWLIEQADAQPYHPDVLATAQRKAKLWRWEDGGYNREAALWYFISTWMYRGGCGGTKNELSGNLALRWTVSGGGNVRRYRTAVEALEAWGQAFKRCEFFCVDGFDFLQQNAADDKRNGIYVDAPWPEVGAKYLHTFSEDDHSRLADLLRLFVKTRVVVRYGAHPLIEKLYRTGWRRVVLTTRNQGNNVTEEWLLIRNG